MYNQIGISVPYDVSVCEDVNIFSDSCNNDTIDNVVAELGNVLGDIQQVQDVDELVSDSDDTEAPSEEKVSCEDKSCEGLEIHQVSSLTARIHKVLSKYSTFPCSKESAYHTSAAGGDDTSDIAGSERCSSIPQKPACNHSLSLPTSSKLVSAIKGTREKHGSPLTKHTVTWAPDVFDPPSTSLSHTVKSYSQQRSRTYRKNSKHKHKGKSSRGSNSEKKHHNNGEKNHPRYSGSSGLFSKSSANSGFMKSELCSMPVATSDVVNSDLLSELGAKYDDNENSELHSISSRTDNAFSMREFSQMSVDLVDYATAKESKCWSSFLRSSISQVHVSVAEAT